MSKENNLTDYLTDIADALREKSGGGYDTSKINPQDFANIIRALPVRGEVDHEWHIYYDDTKPAELYGGTWEELGEGVFLMSAGASGTAGQTGGSNTQIHSLGTPNNTNTFALIQYNFYEQGNGLGMLSGSYSSGYTPVELVKIEGEYTSTYALGDRAAAVQVVGTTQSADNRPQYSTAHIWRKIAQ